MSCKHKYEQNEQGYCEINHIPSITSLATDKEIHELWKIIGTILDRNNIDDSGELSIKLI